MEQRTRNGGARTTLVVLIFAAVLVGFGYFAWKSGRQGGSSAAGVDARPQLTESTRQILANLQAPVTVQYYSLLDPASVPEETRKFADGVSALLSEYEREANGKLTVNQVRKYSDSAAEAASADGIKSFNLDKGNACFLGIALASEGRKEAISQLAPEWPQAVEPDLTRAIARVSTARKTPASPVASSAQEPDKATVEEVKRSLPELATMSLEQGKQALREKAMKDFTSTAKEMEARVKQAQERIVAAKSQGEAEQQVALKELQQVQAEQTQKLKEIAQKLQDEINALEALKR